MESSSTSPDIPDPEVFDDVFLVYETEVNEDTVRYFGTPLVEPRTVMQTVWPIFREEGYDVSLQRDLGEWILVVEPIELGVTGIPWTNVILAVATVASTLFAGAAWYHLDPFSLEILGAWPFAAGIMFVLGVHELGHYAMSRYHQVKASLPYFIPVPTLIGTMGAVIKMEGQIPSRKALFDIGVAGPLAGLVATIAVTIVGLHLPPVHAPDGVMSDPNAIAIELGYPPLLEFLAWVVNQPLAYEDPGTSVNPVVIAGWVGMFVTFLNMIPVGQLDGGHITRSILGDRAASIAAVIPITLFALAGYLYLILGASFQAALIWVIWGFFATFALAMGPALPIKDQSLDRGRIAIGVVAFVLALLCFTPVPLEIHT